MKARHVSGSNKLGVLGATSYVVGSIIGSGIFITPTYIVIQTGSIGLSLVTWLLAGVISLLGAFCYIEAGTSIPQSGGAYAYAYFVGWRPVAFCFMWYTVTLIYPASAAIMVATFGRYMLKAVEPLFCMEPENSRMAAKLTGYLLLMLLTWLNLIPLRRYAGRVQIVVTGFKIVALVIIIGTGLYFIAFKRGAQHFENSFSGSQFSPNLILALYAGLYSYSGWNLLSNGLEDIQNPKRALIVGQFCGCLLSAAIYIGTIVAYVAVLGKEGMLESEVVAATFSERALKSFTYAIPVIVGVVVCGTVNSNIFGSSRFSFAAARNRQLPTCLALVNEQSDSPRTAVLFECLAAIVYSFVANLEELINYVMFTEWLQHAAVIMAILWIRYKKIPVHPAAIRMPIWLHVIFLIICLILLVVPVFTSPALTAIGCAITLSGLLVYYSIVWPTKQLPQWACSINDSMTKFCQIILCCLVEDTTTKR